MITRSNYEEFFLLYVDNELSAAEKIAVERFVEENPDLREEWETTLQCKLTPDQTTGFGDLDLLLRKTETIDQDRLLSYLDRELDPVAATEVGAALQSDTALQQEFALLRKTVSKPDTTITFPDKSTLYRKEDRRVVYMPWLRLAAAAAVIGVIVMIIFRSGHTHTNNPQDRIVKKSPERTVTPATPRTLHPTEADKQPEQQEQLVARVPEKEKQTTDQITRTPEPLQIARKAELLQIAGKPEPRQIAHVEEARTTVEPEVASQKLATASHAEIVAQTGKVEIKTGNVEIRADRPLPTAAGTTSPAKEGASFATQALLADNNIEDQEIDGEEPSGKKHKLRGFFRKVSRVLEKSANRDDDDKHSVLIGGFQFALK